MSEDRTSKPVPFRGGGFTTRPYRWVGFAVFALLLILAEIGTRTGFISALTLPRPSDVLGTFRDLYASGMLWTHLLPSLTRLFVGALLGAGVGIATGVLIGAVLLCPCRRLPRGGGAVSDSENRLAAVVRDLVRHR